jgi:hypothetical protein
MSPSLAAFDLGFGVVAFVGEGVGLTVGVGVAVGGGAAVGVTVGVGADDPPEHAVNPNSNAAVKKSLTLPADMAPSVVGMPSLRWEARR